jgi:hypothetical protein
VLVRTTQTCRIHKIQNFIGDIGQKLARVDPMKYKRDVDSKFLITSIERRKKICLMTKILFKCCLLEREKARGSGIRDVTILERHSK